MASVIVNVGSTPTPFPAGTAPAGISISISDGVSAPQIIAASPYSATFSNVAPGTYTASAQQVSGSGLPLGAAMVSAEFTVEADVSVDIPSSISVTVS